MRARNQKAWSILGILSTTMALSSLPASAQSSVEGWTLSITPYAWGTGIAGTVGIHDRPVEIDASFSDLIKNTDFALMFATEARYARWSLDSELVLFKLSDHAGTPGPLFSGVQVGAKQTLIDLSPRYRVIESNQVAIDVLMGARVWHLSSSLLFQQGALPDVLVEGGDRWIDPIVGFKTFARVGDRWHVEARGDVGGFGVGSNFTWQALGGIGYRFSKTFTLRSGYRHLDVDFEDEDAAFTFDVGMGGFVLGGTIALGAKPETVLGNR
jgi:hypothetical protein